MLGFTLLALRLLLGALRLPALLPGLGLGLHGLALLLRVRFGARLLALPLRLRLGARGLLLFGGGLALRFHRLTAFLARRLRGGPGLFGLSRFFLARLVLSRRLDGRRCGCLGRRRHRRWRRLLAWLFEATPATRTRQRFAIERPQLAGRRSGRRRSASGRGCGGRRRFGGLRRGRCSYIGARGLFSQHAHPTWALAHGGRRRLGCDRGCRRGLLRRRGIAREHLLILDFARRTHAGARRVGADRRRLRARGQAAPQFAAAEQFALTAALRCFAHRARVGEHVLRHHGHRAGRHAIAIAALRRRGRLHLRLGGRRALHLRQRHGIGAAVARVGALEVGGGERRVGRVHRAEIARAHRVGRVIDVARAEREPADRTADVLDEGNQRRRVDRARVARTGQPAPASVDPRPAAVVRGCKGPELVVDPGPAPRLLPDPLAILVRRPTGVHVGREPDVAVAGITRPAAVVVEIGETDQVVAEVAQSHRAVDALVAHAHVAVEVVLRREGVHLVVADVLAVENNHVAPAHRKAAARAVDHGDAFARLDRGGVAVAIDVDAEVAGPVDDQRQVGRVDLHALAGEHAPDAHVDRAFRDFDLQHPIVKLEELHAGFTIHAQPHAAGLHLGARAAVRPQGVATQERAIAVGVVPVAITRR